MSLVFAILVLRSLLSVAVFCLSFIIAILFLLCAHVGFDLFLRDFIAIFVVELLRLASIVLVVLILSIVLIFLVLFVAIPTIFVNDFLLMMRPLLLVLLSIVLMIGRSVLLVASTGSHAWSPIHIRILLKLL